jgi:predicted ferric reductase
VSNIDRTNPAASGANPWSVLGLFISSLVGVGAAWLSLPYLLPALMQSLGGAAPQAYWFMSRGSAFAALGLLWVSMVLGLLITNKMSKLWPGAPAAFAIHEYVSLLGMAFAAFHALILLADRYTHYQWVQLLVPFASTPYRPLWVGVGQLGFYIWVIVNLSFYIRGLIGSKAWRWIHFASFLMFLMAILHGLTSGTDTSAPWAQWIYWSLGGSFLFLTVYRMLISVENRLLPAEPRREAVRPTPAPQPSPAPSDPRGP